MAIGIVAAAAQEGEHVVVVLLQTFCLGADNGVRAIGQEQAQVGNAVQDVSFGKGMQTVLQDEVERLGVYHLERCFALSSHLRASVASLGRMLRVAVGAGSSSVSVRAGSN